MAIDLVFAPDAARARALNARMNRELADSLAYVSDAARGQLPFDEAGLGGVIAALRNGEPFAPGVFARYYALVNAIGAEDDSAAVALFGELARSRAVPATLQIVALDDQALGEEGALYARMMNAEAGLDIAFAAPSAQVSADFRLRLNDGLALLDRALPDLAGEIRAIVRQIVIVGSDPTKVMQFDGGSHYQLWGALFLNGSYHPDPMAVVEVLAHECAHSLLFGFCTDQALIENDDEERFASPLRPDPRPMDGIYHATYVSARMHWAMTRLAADPLLAPEARERALAAARADLVNFDAGYSVVAEHGRLTGLGQGLMASALAYVDAARR